jgi:hypothetical protein
MAIGGTSRDLQLEDGKGHVSENIYLGMRAGQVFFPVLEEGRPH